VITKKAAAEWAVEALGPRWTPLIQAAQAARGAAPDVRLGQADPEAVAETFALLDEAARRAKTGAAPVDRSREIIARVLAEKSHRDGPRGGASFSPGQARGGPRRGQYNPPPSRPGGRGRRG